MEEIWNNPHNSFCADCNQPNPQRMNMHLEVTICMDCAHLHKTLLDCNYNVVDVAMQMDDVAVFTNFTGNLQSNQYYESNIPAFIHKPDHNSPHMLKEQWILAKYNRKEFAQDTISQIIWYNKFDFKVGWLWKKEKKASGQRFRKRYFALDRNLETFSYYMQADDAEPKSTCPIDSISVYLSPELIDERNSMQIVMKKDGIRRSIFIYSETSEDIYNWYMAIRSLKWITFKSSNSHIKKEILYTMVPHGYLKKGWLYKTGRKPNDRVYIRWFCLENGSLVYSEQPLDPYNKGEISLICKELCDVEISYEDGYSIADDTFCFSLKTPDRRYYFASYDKNDRKDWIENISIVIGHSKNEIIRTF